MVLTNVPMVLFLLVVPSSVLGILLAAQSFIELRVELIELVVSHRLAIGSYVAYGRIVRVMSLKDGAVVGLLVVLSRMVLSEVV